MLIDVAYLGKSDNDSLVFFDGDKHGIWPSMILNYVALFNYLWNMLTLTDHVPYDGTPRTKITTIALPVTIVLTFLNIFGIFFAMICLFFNIIYRKRRC